MRLRGIILISLVLFVNSIVCSDNNDVYDEKHIQFGAHPDDFPKQLKTIPTAPYKNANIRVLYDDDTREPKEVVEKLDMIARGKTIIGHDGHSRGFFPKVHPIFNSKGVLCFQHKDDRSKTWPVPYEMAEKWGLMSPSPSDPAYVQKNRGQRGETSRAGGEGMNVPMTHDGHDTAKRLRVIEALQAALPPEYIHRGHLNSGPSGKEIIRKPRGRPKGNYKGKAKQ